MAIPEKYRQIASIFQRALIRDSLEEAKDISLDNLKMAKSHLIPDKNMPYYQLLSDFIAQKEKTEDKKKSLGIEIHKINGDVVVSQNQQGGITSHESIASVKLSAKKKPFLEKAYYVVAIIFTMLGILGWFGIKPILEGKAIENKENKPISINNVDNDVVISQNQSGGITAHTVNVGQKQERHLTEALASQLISGLPPEKKEIISLRYTTNDAEAYAYAKEFKKFLEFKGWKVEEPLPAMFFNKEPRQGVYVAPPKNGKISISVYSQ